MEIKLPVSSYRTKLYWLHFMKWTDATSDLNITDLKRTFNLWEIWILKTGGWACWRAGLLRLSLSGQNSLFAVSKTSRNWARVTPFYSAAAIGVLFSCFYFCPSKKEQRSKATIGLNNRHLFQTFLLNFKFPSLLVVMVAAQYNPVVATTLLSLPGRAARHVQRSSSGTPPALLSTIWPPLPPDQLD